MSNFDCQMANMEQPERPLLNGQKTDHQGQEIGLGKGKLWENKGKGSGVKGGRRISGAKAD